MAKLLIVDDDRDLAEVMTFILENRGYEVCRAVDGEEGLRLLHEWSPDVVVLDVEMPKLTGPEMVERLILRDAGDEKTPVVLISGVVDLPALARASGVHYCITKPYSADTLTKAVERALREQRPLGTG